MLSPQGRVENGKVRVTLLDHPQTVPYVIEDEDGARAVARSPLPGPSGNVEFFLWLRRGPAAVSDTDIHTSVVGAPAEGAGSERVEP